jgi:hypothetical protein
LKETIAKADSLLLLKGTVSRVALTNLQMLSKSPLILGVPF